LSDVSEWVTAGGTCVGAIAVAVGLYYTQYQINLAREAQQANVIYNVQKDYHDLFTQTAVADFQKCFGGTSSLPNACTSKTARDTFFDMLNYVQLLIDLQNLHAVDAQYVNSKVSQFCSFLTQGSFTFDEFRKQQHLVSDELAKRLSELCGVQL
jgi:hypothetical protein